MKTAMKLLRGDVIKKPTNFPHFHVWKSTNKIKVVSKSVIVKEHVFVEWHVSHHILWSTIFHQSVVSIIF